MPLQNHNWHKASRSLSHGGERIELASVPSVHWRRSSYTASNGGNCVELADVAGTSVVAVRDSKDPDGPVLLLTRAALRAAIQSGADTH